MRSTLAFLLLLVGVVLVPVATAGRWGYDALVPADGFVETVAPLATHPAVVDEVEDRLTTATTARITQSTGVTGEQVQRLVRVAVQQAVADPAYARVWRASTRDVHRQLLAVLRADTPATGSVGLSLASLSDVVRRELVSAGIPLADQLPTVRATVALVPSADLARAQGAFEVLEGWGPVLPFVAAVLLVLGVVVARRRTRSLARACVGVLVGLGLLAVVVLVARVAAAEALPSLPTPVARAVFDTLVAGLWRDIGLVAVGALVGLLGSVLVTRGTHR